MIRRLCTGLYSDDDVAEGFVAVELRVAGRSHIDLHCGPATATRILVECTWGKVHDLFEDQPGQTFAIPPQYLQPALEDEMLDVVMALRLLEPEMISSHCQYPPCVLGSARVVAGYSLCSHHGDRLVDRAEEFAA